MDISLSDGAKRSWAYKSCAKDPARRPRYVATAEEFLSELLTGEHVEAGSHWEGAPTRACGPLVGLARVL